MSDDKLLLEKDGAIATITFNNPKALNALTVEMFEKLTRLLEALAKDESVRVVILTGAGEKAFAAGGDINHLASLNPTSAREFALLGQRVIDQVESFPKPVIAAINGYCLGGGNELAMGCDLRIAADTAKFGQPEVRLGIIPGFAGAPRLSRLVGKAKAKELIFTGEAIDAGEAWRIGLVNRVVPKERLMEETRALALKICSNSPTAVKLAKEVIDHGLEMDSVHAARYEADHFALCFTTADCKEGISAFLEKRPTRF
ncbi:MAG: enoyl-CoA hydratase/isomerase family protein [Desulfuromonadales bacterium]